MAPSEEYAAGAGQAAALLSHVPLALVPVPRLSSLRLVIIRIRSLVVIGGLSVGGWFCGLGVI